MANECQMPLRQITLMPDAINPMPDAIIQLERMKLCEVWEVEEPAEK